MENPIRLQTPETVQKKTSRFLLLASAFIVLLIVGAVGMYAWYYRYNTCEVNAVEEASAFLAGRMDRFDAVAQVATTAFRTDLTRPLYELKQTYMDTQAVDVPACMRTAKKELLNYMKTVISAFQAYAVSEADSKIRSLLDQSDRHFNNFKNELKAIKKCAPFCAPWD